MGHTTQAGVDLLGFGPSAISELRASYAQSLRDEPEWRAARGASAGSPPCAATASRATISSGAGSSVGSCATASCAPASSARPSGASWRRRTPQSFSPCSRRRTTASCSLAADGSLTVTPAGRLLVRNLAMAFDAHLDAQRRSGQRMFSKTV